MTIKTVIAEDDNFSLKYLKNFISGYTDFEIVAETTTGIQLLEKAMQLRPDVAFLDIDLPGMDGITVARRLVEKFPNIIIVFVTAHSDFAVDAFEVSSLDYIVKPFSDKRIKKTIARIREKTNEHKKDLTKIANLLKNPEKLYIKTGHEIHFIDADTIYFIERKQRKTIIYTTKKKYETYETIQDLEDRLNHNFFFRAHKSYLINLRMIEKIIPFGDSSFMVRFKDCHQEALMSRPKANILYQLLNL